MSVLAVLLLVLGMAFDSVRRMWTQSRARSDQFRETRVAFERMARHLAQASLNTYWDYDDPAAPTRYVRMSELQFASGPTVDLLAGTPDLRPGHGVFFQAPLGRTEDAHHRVLEELYNAVGYFVQFGDDSETRPAFLDGHPSLPARHRFRLVEFLPPAEDNLVFQSHEDFLDSGDLSERRAWFAVAGDTDAPIETIAENIVLLLVRPLASDPEASAPIAPDLAFDSADESRPETLHLMPPQIDLLAVAIDELSAQRLADEHGTSPPALVDPLWFDTDSEFDADLQALEDRLVDLHLSFRIFRKTVTMRAAKWTL